jgi:type II secretory pathway component GspD/PulD (secretin)
VQNNGSATIVAKQEQPTTTLTLGTTSELSQETFNEYVDAGITLEISPSISAANHLRLSISLQVSTFLGAVQGSVPPPRATREIMTTVNVPDGDTMVIGGIIEDTSNKTRNAVPFLGDIPIIGYLFRRDSDNKDRTSLYFFVTPHIMRDREFADLAEYTYKKKLEAADTIGADRIRILDPGFHRDAQGVDLRGFELPLYRSPTTGEVDRSQVGIGSEELRDKLDPKASEDASKDPLPPPFEQDPDLDPKKEEDGR